MSSTVIKNIIHKFLDKNINILYGPTYSMFDYMVFDLPFNFFVNKPYRISKDNVISVMDVTLFDYDLVWINGLTPTDLGQKLHVPILQYVPSFITDSMDISHNTFYVLEGADETRNKNLVPIDLPWVQPSGNIDKIGDTAIINCYESKLDPKILHFFHDKIPNVHVIEELKDLPQISKYRTVIDLYPNNISNLYFALANNTVYITTPRPNTNAYQQMYKNIILGSMILDVIKHNENALNTYSPNSFAADHALMTEFKWHNKMIEHINNLKHTGFYIS